MDYVYLLFYVRVNLAGVVSAPELVDIFKNLVDAEKQKDYINTTLQRNGIDWEYTYVSRWEVK